MCGDARCGAVFVVDGYCVRRLVWFLVVREHHREVEGLNPCGMDGYTYEAAENVNKRR